MLRESQTASDIQSMICQIGDTLSGLALTKHAPHLKQWVEMSCSTCHKHTDECCSYCFLPVCSEHGKHIQPWFTRPQVPVCTPCQARLQEIAQEEQSSSLAANPRHRAAVVHVLPRDGDAIVSSQRLLSSYT